MISGMIITKKINKFFNHFLVINSRNAANKTDKGKNIKINKFKFLFGVKIKIDIPIKIDETISI